MKTDEKKIEESMAKIKNDKFEIKINTNQYLVDSATSQIKVIEDQLKAEDLSEQEKTSLESSKKLLNEVVVNNSNKFIEGYLVPLKYSDLMSIKADIYDAMKTGEDIGLSDNAKLYAVMMHERTMTVYLSLRKKEDIAKRHFSNREEVAMLPNTFTNDVYSTYVREFLLTEEERKNS
jgi:hypothetical protein